MNKLLIPSSNVGGHPLTLDDLRFAQDGIIDAFKGLAISFGATDTDAYILFGCAVTGPVSGVYSIAAGYAVYKGEVCKVEAHTVNPLLDITFTKFAIIPSVYDTGSLKSYKSGATYQTRTIRNAKFYTAPSAPVDCVDYNDVLRFDVKIINKIKSSAVAVSFFTGMVNYGSPYGEVLCRLDRVNNKVLLEGMGKASSPVTSTTDVHLFNLPSSDYYPSVQREVAGASLGGNFVSGFPVVYIIKTTGEVWAKAVVGNAFSTSQWSLDGVSYNL